MRRLIDFVRGSFSARLSLWVVLFTALIFLASQGYFTVTSRKSVRAEAISGANQVLDNTCLRLERIIDEVERAADNLEWLVYRHLNSPDTLLEYSRITLQGMDFLTGCSISFEPYYFEGQRYFSAYSSNNDGVVTTVQEGDDDYQYFYLDWYLLPKLLNQPCWTEPYSDWEYDDDYSLPTEMLISYCKPLTDNSGAFIGVISLDLSLKWLSSTLAGIKPYPHSYCTLVSRGGTFLVHPDPEKLFYQTVFTNSLLAPDPEFDRIGRDVISGKEGMEEVILGGEDTYMFFQPMRNTGWSLAIICPENDIFGNFDKLSSVASVIIFIGLLMLFVTCFFVIRKTMKPLETLAGEAEFIAAGDFDHRPPDDEGRNDEIGVLSRSFAHMQDSLVSYIDELTQATATRERIEGELRIAHGIQMRMIPSVFPPFPERKELDLFASMTPAKEVGGDLYDYFILDGKLYFCIGDVSGKGIPASLLMAESIALFRIMGKQGLKPTSIVSRSNELISENNETMMFVTLFVGRIDLETGLMEYCNCGHNPPFLLRPEGGIVKLGEVSNIPVGAERNWDFQGQEFPDVRGCKFFLYTDGLTEAENLDHDQFGEQRLEDVLVRSASADAQSTIAGVAESVAAYLGQAEASDDLTMLCIRLGKQ